VLAPSADEMGVGRCCCRSGGVASASIGGPHRRNTSSSIAYFFFCFCFVFFFFSLVSQRTCRSVFRRTADKTRRNLPPAMSTFLSSSTKLVSLDAANWNALEDVCTVWVLKKQMKNSVFQPIQRFSNAYDPKNRRCQNVSQVSIHPDLHDNL